MKSGNRFPLAILASFLLLFSIAAGPQTALAHPNFFSSLCSGCHNNDNATCNGCHHHGTVGLSATPNKSSYACGEQVTVTLTGGSQSGWIRALLYDQNDVEIARRSGPTGTGDDSQPNPVAFPVNLTANAPVGKGVYTWHAAWWGSPYDVGNTTVTPHGPAVLVAVTINVVGPSPVDSSTWSRIKALSLSSVLSNAHNQF